MMPQGSERDPGSIAVVLGTRPEIIKLAPLVKLLGTRVRVIHTGQHYDRTLASSFFDELGFAPLSETLSIGGTSRGQQIGAAVAALDELFADTEPNVVVVQGDTNTTLAAALAANARGFPICHVEAGLRSFDRRMPEEHNRVLVDHLADLLMAPTEVAASNLIAEGIDEGRVYITGNTVVEAVQHMLPSPGTRKRLLGDLGLEASKFVLSTFHRPENVDDSEVFARILSSLAALELPVVLPLHPRSRERLERFGLSSMLNALMVIEPVGYEAFLGLSAESALLISDSGGVQEEASIYKRPVIVVRRSTERPEVLGTFARLVEPSDDIAKTAKEWIGDLELIHDELAGLPSPYGDGSASEKIAIELLNRF